MARIFYSLCGEGRGHAARARTLIDDLCHFHDITVYAPAHAYAMLAPLYHGSHNVKVVHIPGLMFHYNGKRRLDYLCTAINSMEYLRGASSLVRRLCDDIDRDEPDLVITDFEPALARAAEKCHVPYISVDHQHFLTTYDLSSLPPFLRMKAEVMGRFLRFFYDKQIKTIVSSFYFPPLRADVANVTQVGVFLNSRIRSMQPTDGKHILVYLRRFLDHNLIRTLCKLDRPVVVYNETLSEHWANIEFKLISPHSFFDDLASCSCLVSTAGNQLVGEAIHLGKPVFAIPEADNFEQQINGHFLNDSGAGMNCDMHRVNTDTLRLFLDNLPMYKTRIIRDRVPGNEVVCAQIHEMLGVRDSAERYPEAI